MTFVQVPQTEILECKDGRHVQASIRLGEHEGRWFFALSHQQRGGDFWASSSPLGYSEAYPRRDFASRDEALAGAIAHAGDRWAGRQREMAPHFAWLDTLIPEQRDLFGAAA